MEHETTKTEEKGDDIDVSIPTTKTATPLTQVPFQVVPQPVLLVELVNIII